MELILLIWSVPLVEKLYEAQGVDMVSDNENNETADAV